MQNTRTFDGTPAASGSLSDKPYLDKIKDVSYRPVFILGHHRSGTTILYTLLSRTGCFNVFTAYHALRYGELLANHEHGRTDQAREDLNHMFSTLGLQTRLVDHLEWNADYTEEYCFVLQAHSRRFHITKKNVALFDEICRKIQYISDSSRMLLLKNPFDFGNFITVKELIPNARFVFIHRDPVPVLSSTLKMVRKNWQEGNPINDLYSKTYARLQRNRFFVGLMRWMTGAHSKIQLGRRLLAFRLARNSNYFLRHIESLPRSDYVSIRYEDLCDDPTGTMRVVLDFLSVEPRAEMEFEKWVQPRPLPLLPEVGRIEAKLRKKFHRVLVYHGYEV